MTRFGPVLAIAALTSVAVLEQHALADEDPVSAKASSLNDEGKVLFSQGDLEEAAGKFRAAIALAPQARFYFNLCFLLNARGELEGALGACAEVGTSDGADDRIRERTEKLIASIEKKRQKKAAAGSKPSPYGGGETPPPKPQPVNVNPGPGSPAVNPPSSAGPAAAPRRYQPPAGRPVALKAASKPQPHKRFHLGVVTGFTGSSLDGIDVNSRFGFTAGAFVASAFSRILSFQAEISYVQRGASGTNFNGSNAIDFELTTDYVVVPVLAKLQIPLGDTSRLHIESGFSLGFLTSSSSSVIDESVDPLPVPPTQFGELSSVDVAGVIGGGMTFHRRGSSAWLLTIRREIGLTEVEPNYDTKHRTTSFTAGYAW